MFPIGIDWSEKHLDYCIENNSGDVIRGRRRDRIAPLRSRVDNDDSGFNSMLQSFAKEKIDLSEIAVAIESPNQRIVDFLCAVRALCSPSASAWHFSLPCESLARAIARAQPFMATAKVAFPLETSQMLLTLNCLLTIFASIRSILEFGVYPSQSYAN